MLVVLTPKVLACSKYDIPHNDLEYETKIVSENLITTSRRRRTTKRRAPDVLMTWRWPLGSRERVHLAQILGMADDVTLTLGLEGFNALKLVPFGAFEEVLPWLLRRLEENQDGLAAAADERPLLRRELGRRLGLVA